MKSVHFLSRDAGPFVGCSPARVSLGGRNALSASGSEGRGRTRLYEPGTLGAVPARSHHLSEEQCERMSQRNAALWEDENYRKNATEKLRAAWRERGGRTADDRARIGERSRRMWADPGFRSKMGRAFRLGWQLRRERLAADAAGPQNDTAGTAPNVSGWHCPGRCVPLWRHASRSGAPRQTRPVSDRRDDGGGLLPGQSARRALRPAACR